MEINKSKKTKIDIPQVDSGRHSKVIPETADSINPKSKKAPVTLLLLGAFLLPFLGFLFIYNSSLVEIFYDNHIAHLILMAIVGILAFYTTYFTYKVYKKDRDVRIFFIALAFYAFGFVFMFHAVSSLGAVWLGGIISFSEAIFDITEHFGLLIGSLFLLGLTLPIQNSKDRVYKNRVRIFVTLAVTLLVGLISLLAFPGFAENINVDLVAVGPTALFFTILSLFFLREYRKNPNTLLLYITLSFGVLINSAIIPFFYEEWNILWWYFHFTFLLGFLLILYGFTRHQAKGVKGKSKTVFKEAPLYTRFYFKLTMFVSAVAIIPLTIVLIIGFGTFEKNVEQQAVEEMLLVAEAKEGHLFSYMSEVMGRTVDFSSDGFIRDSVQNIIDNPENEDLVDELNRHLKVNKMSVDESIYGINIARLDGRIIASTNPAEIGRDESGDSYFTDALELSYGNAIMSDIVVSHHFGAGENAIISSASLTNKETDEKIGIIINFYNTNQLDDILTGEQQISLGALSGLVNIKETLDIYLVNKDKLMITESRFFGKDVFLKQVVDTKPVQSCLESQNEISGLWFDYRGVPVYGAAMCIVRHGHEWILLAEIDQEEAFAPILALRYTMTIIILLVFVLSGLLIIYFSRKLTKPIEILTEVSEKITGGDLNARASIESRDEIGILARNFNKMINSVRQEKLNLEQRVKNRTKELQQETLKLEQIAQNMKVGAILLNDKGEVIFANKKAKEILKIGNAGENPIEKLFSKFKKPDVEVNFYKCISGAPSKEMEVEDDGEIFKLSFSCLKSREEGEIFGHIVWIENVTEEELIDRAKSDFVSIASHQLRTPLTAVKLFTEMLLDGQVGELNAKQEEYVSNVAKSTDRVIELVNDLLNVSRLESSTLKVEPEPTDLVSFIESVVGDVSPLAKEKTCRVDFEKPAEKLQNVPIDQILLRQVIANVVSNAIRYSTSGGCEVKVGLRKTKEGYIISVSDNGIGIPEKNKKNIFEKFFRADNAAKAAAEGTGLGLFVSKMIIETAGGKIWFESEEGKGTTFYVNIPIGGMVEREGTKVLIEDGKH